MARAFPDLAAAPGFGRVTPMKFLRTFVHSVALGMVLIGALLGPACQQSKPPATAAMAPASAPAPAPASSRAPSLAQALPDDSVPAIARREVIRRQEQIRRMDEAALRASQAMAEDDLEGAVGGYRRAVDGLP